MRNLRDGEAASVGRATQFVANKGVIEASGGGIGSAGGVKDAFKPRPIDRAEAHGTRFAGSVEIAAGQLEIAEGATSLANGFDFSVSSGIVGGRDAVDGFGDDLAILHDESGEGTALAGVYIFGGQGDGALQEWIGHDGASPAVQSAARAQDTQYGLGRLERKGALVAGIAGTEVARGNALAEMGSSVPDPCGWSGLQGTRMRVG